MKKHKSKVYANVVQDKKSRVEGIVFLITNEAVLLIDNYEESPQEYNKSFLYVWISGKFIKVLLYKRKSFLKGAPDLNYQKEIYHAAIHHNLNLSYIKKYITSCP